jgi:predicted peptidase
MKANRFIPLVSLAALLVTSQSPAADPAPGKQVEQSFTSSAGTVVPYLLYLPAERAPRAKAPTMLFLHGRGESRGPLSIVAKWGPPRMAARGDDLPYIIVSPQCPAETRWTAPEQQAAVIELLDHIVEKFSGDPARLYLTGLSMGGYGTWKLAALHAEKFAAAAPVCGGGDPADAAKLKEIPLWVWHGTEDDPVPYSKSVEMVEAIEKAGGDKVRFTTLKHVGHNCWSAAYATPELYSWFASHSR